MAKSMLLKTLLAAFLFFSLIHNSGAAPVRNETSKFITVMVFATLLFSVSYVTFWANVLMCGKEFVPYFGNIAT